MSRTTVAILSTENLLHNLHVIKKRVGCVKIIAMVKANAYGHGLRSVSSRLDKHVDMLGVASIDEALALRKIGVTTPIVLAEGVFEQNELIVASIEKFHVVFHNPQQVEWLEKSSLPLPLHAWIKINTGMGRLGFSLDDGDHFYSRLSASSQLIQPVNILSHFACSDDVSHELNDKQKEAFTLFISSKTGGMRSLCNSAGIFHFPDYHYDVVRPGIALYGISPIEGVSALSLGLKPVMTLQSTLISVQMMKKGASIGYGARYRCPRDMLVGVIACGYGDGYPIAAGDGTPVLVNNKECSLIGRVSMDMMTVDLTPCLDARVGDHVILWGAGLPIERVALHAQTIAYALVTSVQHRVKFMWTRLH